MNYAIEIYDTWNRRIARITEVPLVRAIRRTPDRPDEVRGILPEGVTDLGHGYRIRVLVENELFCEAVVTQVEPRWSDSQKLILDRLVQFHEIVEFRAERPARLGNSVVSRAFTNRTVSEIVKSAINSALGRVHYYVDHTVYPEGAQREFQKFTNRQTAGNELEVGGIDEGQWVASNRIDATQAFAKDGDTIAGLKVDGLDWPDVRLMMVDTEETSINSHTIKIHPEVADWTAAQYDASGYKVKADAATAFLQGLIDADGVDFIELNPHRDASGNFDDRVDVFGRYIGLVYGGGKCFNAAIVENGHSDVYLFADGQFHVPEMELKDYFSYTGVHGNSIEDSPEILVNYDVTAGIYEILTAMAYAAGGFVWSMDPSFGIRFRKAERPDRVKFFDPVEFGVSLGSDRGAVANALFFDGNPILSTLRKTYTRQDSIDEYGFTPRFLDYFSVSLEEDADTIAKGILADAAYPEPKGALEFFRGDAVLKVGDIVEVRDGPVRRLERELAGEWDGAFNGKRVARVKAMTHRFSGKEVYTEAELTSPLRSAEDPIGFIVRSQPGATSLFQFRLDEETVGLDLGYHLD